MATKLPGSLRIVLPVFGLTCHSLFVVRTPVRIYRCQRAAIIDHPAADVDDPFGDQGVDEIPARKLTGNCSFGSPMRDRVDDGLGHYLGLNRRHSLSEWHA